MLLVVVSCLVVTVSAVGKRKPVVAPKRPLNATTYSWHGPWVSSGCKASEKKVQIRGLMNTGTNFLSAVLGNAQLKLTEDRKHFFPWILAERGTAAKLTQLDVIMIRHPLSWITGMRKAPYFIDCGLKDPMKYPDARCQLHLSYKNNRRKREPMDTAFSSILDIWNRYYSSYLTWSGCWAIVRYEDLLIDANRSLNVLLDYAHPGHLERRVVALKPAKSHGHSRSFDDARFFNLEKRWLSLFSQDQLRLHCLYANQTLLAFFHYVCP